MPRRKLAGRMPRKRRSASVRSWDYLSGKVFLCPKAADQGEHSGTTTCSLLAKDTRPHLSRKHRAKLGRSNALLYGEIEIDPAQRTRGLQIRAAVRRLRAR